MSTKEALLERISQLPDDQLVQVAAYVAQLTQSPVVAVEWPKLLTDAEADRLQAFLKQEFGQIDGDW